MRMPSVNRAPTISIGDRRTRLARRHHLALEAVAGEATVAARSLIGLHATDPASIFLSARARVPGLTPSDVEDALYDARTLVKHLCMRRTMFVVPDDLLAVVHVACTEAIAVRLRRQLVNDVEQGGIARDGGRWVREAERKTLAALTEGDATGAQLSRRIPQLQAKTVYAEGKKWGGEIGVAGRVFGLLAADGRIRRGRPSGSWTSSQHRWTLAPEADEHRPSVAAAREELVRRWLTAFGPATLGDVVWWTGLGIGVVRAALAGLDVVAVDLEGEADPGIVLADDLAPERPVEPWVALLPSLDSTTMGWKRRVWYVGEHAPMLFDRNGNAGPTVWSNGRIVGGWAQRSTGEVVVRLLEDVGSDVAAAIANESEALQTWLGDTVVTARFPTPIDRAVRTPAPLQPTRTVTD
jgi:Winged helix DNA-binding domain